eukprot:COSAG02_NODE_5840_length_3995_cov_2.573409_4_plen_58_part_00
MFTDPVLLASWEGLGSTREDGKLAAPVPHIPYYWYQLTRPTRPQKSKSSHLIPSKIK